MSLIPVGPRIIVRPVDSEAARSLKAAGLVAASEEKAKTEGEVLSSNIDGIKEGMQVVFNQYGADEVKEGDEKVFIVIEDDILAIREV